MPDPRFRKRKRARKEKKCSRTGERGIHRFISIVLPPVKKCGKEKKGCSSYFPPHFGDAQEKILDHSQRKKKKKVAKGGGKATLLPCGGGGDWRRSLIEGGKSEGKGGKMILVAFVQRKGEIIGISS